MLVVRCCRMCATSARFVLTGIAVRLPWSHGNNKILVRLSASFFCNIQSGGRLDPFGWSRPHRDLISRRMLFPKTPKAALAHCPDDRPTDRPSVVVDVHALKARQRRDSFPLVLFKGGVSAFNTCVHNIYTDIREREREWTIWWRSLSRLGKGEVFFHIGGRWVSFKCHAIAKMSCWWRLGPSQQRP